MNWIEIREAVLWALGVVGSSLGIYNFVRGQKNATRTDDIKVTQLLHDAWDHMGGKHGTYTIYKPTNDLQNLELAHRKISEALKINSKSARAHGELGFYYLNKRKLDFAEDCFRKVLKLEPKNWLSFHLLANFFSECGRHEEAEKAARTSIAMNQNSAYAHSILGRTLFDQRKMDDAASAFRMAVSLEPTDAFLLLNLGGTLVNQEEWAEAVVVLKSVIEMDSNNVDAHGLLGHALQKLEKLDDAEMAYRFAALTNPKSAALVSEYADILIRLERWLEAETACSNLISLDRDNAKYYITLCLVYAKQDKWQDVERIASLGIKRIPDDSDLREHLDDALRRQK